MILHNPQFGAGFDVEDDLVKCLAAHGFTPCHTGGGCFAWRRDVAGGRYDLVTRMGDGLGFWVERDDAEWIACRYDGETGDCIAEPPCAFTLEIAIAWVDTFDVCTRARSDYRIPRAGQPRKDIRIAVRPDTP